MTYGSEQHPVLGDVRGSGKHWSAARRRRRHSHVVSDDQGVTTESRDAVQEPSRRSVSRSVLNRMSVNVTTHPSPVGDCASKPIRCADKSSPMVKTRINRHAALSVEAW